MNTIRKSYAVSSREEILRTFLTDNKGIIGLSLIVLIVLVCLLLVGVLL